MWHKRSAPDYAEAGRNYGLSLFPGGNAGAQRLQVAQNRIQLRP